MVKYRFSFVNVEPSTSNLKLTSTQTHGFIWSEWSSCNDRHMFSRWNMLMVDYTYTFVNRYHGSCVVNNSGNLSMSYRFMTFFLNDWTSHRHLILMILVVLVIMNFRYCLSFSYHSWYVLLCWWWVISTSSCGCNRLLYCILREDLLRLVYHNIWLIH